MVALISRFVLESAVIIVAGVFLTRYADAIGRLTGMGRSLAGFVLLAAATSLPELAVNCQAVLIDAPDLAVGDVMGSSLYNLLILAALDLYQRRGGKMLSPMAAAHALSATMSIVLTAVAMLFILLRSPWSLFGVGPGTILIGLCYLALLRLVSFDQRYAETRQPAPARQPIAAPEPPPLARAVIGYLLATLVIFIAARYLTFTADELAERSELGGTFVGTALVALATSLPELATTWTAVRMGAFELAVGNIFGSNSFNMTVLLVVDVVYRPGPLLARVSVDHVLTAACVIITTAAAMLGILYRAEKRFWIIEPDAALVILLVIGSLVLVFLRGTP